MEIRKAKRQDKARLIEHFKHYKNKKLIENRVNCYLEHNSTIIAEENNEIIGLAQWFVKENPNSGVAEIEEVFVNPNFRGKGIGSGLIDFIIEDIKDFFKANNIKLRKIFLFVSKNNVAARRLYEKFGFKQISELNDLFSHKEQEVFYCLSI